MIADVYARRRLDALWGPVDRPESAYFADGQDEHWRLDGGTAGPGSRMAVARGGQQKRAECSACGQAGEHRPVRLDRHGLPLVMGPASLSVRGGDRARCTYSSRLGCSLARVAHNGLAGAGVVPAAAGKICRGTALIAHAWAGRRLDVLRRSEERAAIALALDRVQNGLHRFDLHAASRGSRMTVARGYRHRGHDGQQQGGKS
jgi:hypothetical protein